MMVRAMTEVNAWNDFEVGDPLSVRVEGVALGGLGSVSQQTLVSLVRGQQNLPRPRS